MKKIISFIIFITYISFINGQNNLNSAKVYRVITRETNHQKLKDIQSDLIAEGIHLKITGIHRALNGNIRSISILVNSLWGKVRYCISDFSEIIIEHNDIIGIGVRGVSLKKR